MPLQVKISEHYFVRQSDEDEEDVRDIGPAVVFYDREDGAHAAVPFARELLEDSAIDVIQLARPGAEKAIAELRQKRSDESKQD